MPFLLHRFFFPVLLQRRLFCIKIPEEWFWIWAFFLFNLTRLGKKRFSCRIGSARCSCELCWTGMCLEGSKRNRAYMSIWGRRGIEVQWLRGNKNWEDCQETAEASIVGNTFIQLWKPYGNEDNNYYYGVIQVTKGANVLVVGVPWLWQRTHSGVLRQQYFWNERWQVLCQSEGRIECRL